MPVERARAHIHIGTKIWQDSRVVKRFRPSWLPVLIAAASACATNPPPYRTDPAVALAGRTTWIVADTGFPKPGRLISASDHAAVTDAVTDRLRSTQIQVLQNDAFQTTFLESAEASGGLTDMDGNLMMDTFDAALRKAARQEAPKADLIVVVWVVAKFVRIREGQADWDGVRRPLRDPESAKKTAAVISLAVFAFSPSSEVAYAARGGLDLAHELPDERKGPLNPTHLEEALRLVIDPLINLVTEDV